jgi:hypothetical protein
VPPRSMPILYFDMKYFLPVERAARKFWLAVVQAANKNVVTNLWRANKPRIDIAENVSDYQCMQEPKIKCRPENAPTPGQRLNKKVKPANE